MKTLILICVVSMLLAAASASAEALKLSETQEAQLNNLQHNVTTCSMFYKLSAQGIRNRENPDEIAVAENSEKVSEHLLESAFVIGQAIGMKEEAMTARAVMSLESLMDDMDNSFINFSLVLHEHAKPCRRLFDALSTQLEAILNK